MQQAGASAPTGPVFRIARRAEVLRPVPRRLAWIQGAEQVRAAEGLCVAANRPASGRGPGIQSVRPSRAAGCGCYQLVAATATAAVHDGEDHDGHQSSQRGSDPKGSAREWHSKPPSLANRSLNRLETTMNAGYSRASSSQERGHLGQVLATCFSVMPWQIATPRLFGTPRQPQPHGAPRRPGVTPLW
jgi:hypothetical protein